MFSNLDLDINTKDRNKTEFKVATSNNLQLDNCNDINLHSNNNINNSNSYKINTPSCMSIIHSSANNLIHVNCDISNNLKNNNNDNFKYKFIKNIIRMLFLSSIKSQGDNYKNLFRKDNCLYEDILKHIILTYEIDYFYESFFSYLQENGLYSNLLYKKTYTNFKINNTKNQNNTQLITTNDNNNTTNNLNYISKDIDIPFDIKLFLEFFQDVCNSLMNNMSEFLKSVLTILHIESKVIFKSIPKNNLSYPLYIFIFFKFLCNLKTLNMLDIPKLDKLNNLEDINNKNKIIPSKRIIQLTKLIINIISNTLFSDNDLDNMFVYNEIIPSCNNKLSTIFENIIEHYVNNEDEIIAIIENTLNSSIKNNYIFDSDLFFVEANYLINV